MKKKWYTDPNKICTFTEHFMAILVLIGIVIASFSLWHEFTVFWNSRFDSNAFMEFIDAIFRVVIGIEFFKLLWKPTKETMIEVLMFVIARHMIIGHSSVTENLLSVVALGILFCIDKFLLHSDSIKILPSDKKIDQNTKEKDVISLLKSLHRIMFIFMLNAGLTAVTLCANAASYSIENNTTASYINNVNYKNGVYNYTLIKKYYRKNSDRPKKVTLAFPKTTKQVKLLVATDESFNNSIIRTGSGSSGRISVDNLLPQTTYYYRIISQNQLLSSGSFDTTGRVRMCNIPGVRNVRDLGGWTGLNGRKIRYGLIYRGAEMNGKHTITSVGKSRMLNDLHIKTEIDFRKSSEMKKKKGRYTFSALGKGVSYKNINIISYKLNNKYVKKQMYKVMKVTFDSVKRGKPVYVHCVIGADRTGTYAFLIEGLLGVSESDLSKDYELTYFYKKRTRMGQKKYPYPKMVSIIKKYRGATLADKFASYFRSLGFTNQQIEEFRNIMLQ